MKKYAEQKYNRHYNTTAHNVGVENFQPLQHKTTDFTTSQPRETSKTTVLAPSQHCETSKTTDFIPSQHCETSNPDVFIPPQRRDTAATLEYRQMCNGLTLTFNRPYNRMGALRGRSPCHQKKILTLGPRPHCPQKIFKTLTFKNTRNHKLIKKEQDHGHQYYPH